MYARQPSDGRIPRNVRIPRNYSGNAFRQETEEASFSSDLREEPIPTPQQLPAPEDSTPQAQGDAIPASAPGSDTPAGKLFPSPGFKLDFGRLFGRDRTGDIGFEELLILGLILLVSQSDTRDDLTFLLLLLLFIQ